jgi:zeaxanthin glucosyltransferase
VLYYGEEKGRKIVETQGLSYIVFPSEEDLSVARSTPTDITKSFDTFIERLAQNFKAHNISHLLVDPLVYPFALAGLRARIDVTYFWVFNPPYFRKRHLPFTSSLTVARSRLVRFLPHILWLFIWLRWQGFLILEIFLRRTAFRRFIKRESSQYGFSFALTSYGFRPDLPSIVLGPQELKQCEDRAFTYLGLGVEQSRQETAFSFPSSKRFVCCSLGGNFDRYDKADSVIKETIGAARLLIDTVFLIQVPVEWPSPSSLPNNVVLRHDLPMIQLLPRAAAAIIHGGFGSLKECIVSQTPMLIIPFRYDQPSNAVNAEAAGIGLALSPRRATADRIRGLLVRLFNEPCFRAALSTVRKKAMEQDLYEEFCDSLLVKQGE